MPRNRSEKEPEWMAGMTPGVREYAKLAAAYYKDRTDSNWTVANSFWNDLSTGERRLCRGFTQDQIDALVSR